MPAIPAGAKVVESESVKLSGFVDSGSKFDPSTPFQTAPTPSVTREERVIPSSEFEEPCCESPAGMAAKKESAKLEKNKRLKREAPESGRVRPMGSLECDSSLFDPLGKKTVSSTSPKSPDHLSRVSRLSTVFLLPSRLNLLDMLDNLDLLNKISRSDPDYEKPTDHLLHAKILVIRFLREVPEL